MLLNVIFLNVIQAILCVSISGLLNFYMLDVIWLKDGLGDFSPIILVFPGIFLIQPQKLSSELYLS